MDACYSTAAGRPPRHEMALEVKPLHLPGEYVTSYRGALLTRDQAAEASRRHGSSYLFALGDASRFLNHAESGSLVAAPAVGGRGVDFFAARDLAEGAGLGGDERAGESRREDKQGGVGAVLSVGASGAGTELSFDYGVGYWAGREDDPAPGRALVFAAVICDL
ncbi:hypothetical protein EMIHUDRAFT_255095 [Emiliania huxleyi CCMP1516]|uniref:SET domain-containing protein n=2 Tax=Emiliania huxleyi TaxID=2903 RepID=A0A0D3JG02_EMIH1|nr:hypothetical protein EMIHUDRAFT_255095 [Emiliania huxleyi CCMP1516]EOD22437.1 hypothetical protein EMIHUDRAFT_255095 [Emiliania huxleyi CCMP1516]|eukprot:XP_005774866.1 hypothetical protein EMIHUDRAFT_255095 [Emiliania huxleyi CCMP1516]